MDTNEFTIHIFLWFIAIALLGSILTVLRRRGRLGHGFALLLGINLAVAVLAISTPENPLLTYLSFFAFTIMVVVPGMLGIVSHRLVQRGRLRTALPLIHLRQMLQPGAGIQYEYQFVQAIALLLEGQAEQAIAQTRQRLHEGEEDHFVHFLLLERLLTLYRLDQRWQPMVRLFEAEGGLSLAQMSPQFASLMVQAYCETDAMPQAMQCFVILQESGIGAFQPAIINAARLCLLAHLGKVEAVEAHLNQQSEPTKKLSNRESRSRTFSEQHRQRFWLAIANARAGNVAAAQAILETLSKQRADKLIAYAATRRLQELPTPLPTREDTVDDTVRATPTVDPELLAQLESPTQEATTYPGQEVSSWRTAPVTVALVAIILIIHAILEATGSSDDLWNLVRWGANFRTTTLFSEPWRAVTSVFLHGGWLHVGFNAYALWILGRFNEQLHSSLRTWIIFFVAGVGGSIASAVYGNPQHISVGASGAIFGLMGAALVALLKLRGQVSEQWRKQAFINLLISFGLQIYIGMTLPMIDNAAHLGGAASGALTAWIMTLAKNRTTPPTSRLPVLRAVAIFAALAVLVSGGFAAQNSPARFIAHLPISETHWHDIRLTTPSHWITVKETQLLLQDPLLNTTTPTLRVLPPELTAPVHVGATELAMKLSELVRRDLQLTSKPSPQSHPRVIAPSVVTGDGQAELALSDPTSEDGSVRHYRLICQVKISHSHVLRLIWKLPASHVDAYRPVLKSTYDSLTWEEKPITTQASL